MLSIKPGNLKHCHYKNMFIGEHAATVLGRSLLFFSVLDVESLMLPL